jgi:hypothetical protein
LLKRGMDASSVVFSEARPRENGVRARTRECCAANMREPAAPCSPRPGAGGNSGLADRRTPPTSALRRLRSSLLGRQTERWMISGEKIKGTTGRYLPVLAQGLLRVLGPYPSHHSLIAVKTGRNHLTE